MRVNLRTSPHPWSWCVALALAVGLGASVAASAAEMEPRPSWCPDGRTVLSGLDGGRVAALSARRQDDQPLRIVTVGSSSTEGSDLADRSRAYPAQLDIRLAVRLGSGRITVINRGRGGEGIPETVARFARDVLPEQPDIVIWQLGANDIVRRADLATTTAQVKSGLDTLATTGALVILMDSQVAPRISQSPALHPIQSMLRREAQAGHVAFWSRYGLMETILADGRTTLGDLVRDDGLHMSVPMHACTAAALVDALEQPLAARPIVAGRR